MKGWVIAVVAIIIVVIAVVGVFGYQQFQQRDALRNIQVSVDGVSVESLNLSTAVLNVSLRFTNPTTNMATLDRTDYTLFINNVSLGTGQNLEKVNIPAGGSVVVSQPFNVSYSGAAQTAWSYLTNNVINWRLVGTAYFDTFLGTVSVPYDLTGSTSR
ncbi:MAG: LEA type 2 family protein [Methanomassiliicoccus sp.]|nr:LEA type 2 family protein [Methanomassiliicoccus sp.]